MTRAGKCHHVKAHIISFTDGWGIQEMKNERENNVKSSPDTGLIALFVMKTTKNVSFYL